MTIAQNLGLLAPRVSTNGTLSYADLTSKPVVISLKGTSITYPGDDLAADPNGGQTLTVTGTGFEATPTVYVGGTIASSVSFVSSTQITFVAPAKTAGTYDVYIVNPGGATAIMVMGISYSGVPNWTTAAGSLGTVESEISIQLQATSNSAVTYALASGSTLPAGITLSSSGLLSGTTNVEQTFSFTVVAIDAENQDTSRSFQVTVSTLDPLFPYNTLLLAANGTNAAQNNTFLDSSANSFTITRTGNATQGTFSPYGANWSNYFDGSGDYLSVPGSSAFAYGTGSFTIEFWIFGLIANDRMIYDARNGGGTGPQHFTTGGYGGSLIGALRYVGSSEIISTAIISDNTWHHCAIVRNGSSAITLYVDGVASGSGTDTTNYTATSGNNLICRNSYGAGGEFNGYLSNFRIVKGVALYTSNFTPSTTPLTAVANTSLLTCQSNRFIDNSSNNFTITRFGETSVQRFSPFNPSTAYTTATYGGSGYFDGTGDKISCAANAAFAFGTGAFTVEFWYYPTTGPDQWDSLFSTGGNGGIFFACRGGFLDWTNNYDQAALIRSNWPTLYQWNHIVLTQNSSGTRSVFINGSRTGTTSSTWSWEGDGISFGENVAGYISNARIVKGTAVYDPNQSTITVPTTPLTAITNTSFLCNFTNAGIIDNAMMTNLETLGSAQISTTQSKFGSASLYFNAGAGDTDFIRTAPGDRFHFTGNFTIEFWMYPLTVSTSFSSDSYSAIIDNDASAGAGNTDWFVFHQQDQSLYFATQAGNTSMQTGNVITSANQWYHVALTRSGSAARIFVNGIQSASTTITGTLGATNRRTLIANQPGTSRWFKGYLDDFRVTKGVARYTANFTPPTTAHKLR